jgi:D-amino peptidase
MRGWAVFPWTAVAAVSVAIDLRPAPADPNRAALRVLVYHDMEGLAGQTDPNTFRFNHPDAYPKGRQYLVADLNAVIGGLFDGGATEVDVVDAHGSGNPEPDVITADLDPRAKQVFRDRPFRQYVDLVAPGVYDAVVAVGMHAKTGSRGFASHTYTIGMDILINGKSITESELVGYSWGRVGVPMLMVTGDDRLEADLATMPWIEFVVTKTAVTADSVIPRPVADVHAEMRTAAKRAVEQRNRAKPMVLRGPIRAALRAVPPASLELLDGVPGINYHDNTVEFTAKDFGAAYDGVVALIAVARQSYSDLYRDLIVGRGQPEAGRLTQEYADRLFRRWFDVESGRWKPRAPSPPAAGRRYHGAN